jgi:hypothetical protein
MIIKLKNLIVERKIKPLLAKELKRQLSNLLYNTFILHPHFKEYDFSRDLLKQYLETDIWKHISESHIVLSIKPDFLQLKNKFSGSNPGNDTNKKIKFIEWLNNEAYKRGWFISMDPSDKNESGEKSLERGLWINITFQPNYTLRYDLPRTPMYHITPFSNVERILKRGLVPKAKKSENRTLPPKNYVFINKDSAEEIAENWKISWAINDYYGMPNSDRGAEDFIILEIDPNNLPKGIKFYKDPEFENKYGAIWTYSTIPPGAIKILNIDTYNRVKKDSDDFNDTDPVFENKNTINENTEKLSIDDIEEILSSKRYSWEAGPTLRTIESFYYDNDTSKHQLASDYIDLLNNVKSKALDIGKALNIPHIDGKSINYCLLHQTEFYNKVEDFFPFPLYISSAQNDEATIGIMVDINGKVLEIHEGNDEASVESINLANKLLNPGGKKERIYGAHGIKVVNNIEEKGYLPPNLYVSPYRPHAESYIGYTNDRLLFTGIININDISQESDLDWKTLGTTKIDKFRLL